MTLKDSENKILPNAHPLGKLKAYTTADGSLSLHSELFNENFHSSSGAYSEALKKFLVPAQLHRFPKDKRINILDVCFGLGYNSACLIEALLNSSINMEWWGLEIDKRPLKIALNSIDFKTRWSPDIFKLLKSINQSDKWIFNNSKGNIIWGDARKMLLLIPQEIKFDLILLDAFSPNQCPQLWTEEFLKSLSNRLVRGGRLTTYCRAAAIRSSLKRAGLLITSLVPNAQKPKEWSQGTVAIKPTKNQTEASREAIWQPLSLMEQEHLLTRAAIPYRDLSGEDSKNQILIRRKKEQLNSKLESTTAWKKRWKQ